MNKVLSTRESNIELLRILLIFSVVMHHLIVHGSYLVKVESLPNTFGTYQKLLWEPFLLGTINCFIFISGYYKIDLKITRLFSFVLQALFYSVSILVIFYIFSIQSFVWKDFIKSFIPISRGVWWFASTYFWLMLLSPVLNYMSDKLSRSMFEYLLIIGGMLNIVFGFIFHLWSLGARGNTLISFIFIYLLARYFRLFNMGTTWKKSSLFLIFIGCSLFMAFLTMTLFYLGKSNLIWYLYDGNNPLSLIQAVCIFFMFKSIKFRNNFINGIASTVFGVYLIHEHPLIRNYIYLKIFVINSFAETFYYFPFLLIFTTIIFGSCTFIEYLRAYVMSPIAGHFIKIGFINACDIKLQKLKSDQ